MAADLVQPSVSRLSIGQLDKSDATACSTISQQVEVLPDHAKLPRLLQELKTRSVERADGEKVLIFANTKKGCDQLAIDLRAKSIHTADAIHANRTQQEREEVLAAFVGGDCRCLVATDVAARGIHVNDIALVVRVLVCFAYRSVNVLSRSIGISHARLARQGSRTTCIGEQATAPLLLSHVPMTPTFVSHTCLWQHRADWAGWEQGRCTYVLSHQGGR